MKIENIPAAMWPACFGNELSNDREVIVSACAEGDIAAQLLFAELFRYNVLLLAQRDEELWTALDHLGSYAYKFWKSRNMKEAECFLKAQLWAKVITQELLPTKISLRIARPGNPKDATWMNYRPGDPRPIQKVDSWAVISGRGNAVKRALIQ